MALELKQEQKLQLNQGQIQSLDILALTNQELEEFLTEEYLENPLLECTIDKKSDLIGNLESFYEKGETFQDLYLAWDGGGADIAEDASRRQDVRDFNVTQIDEQLLSQLDMEAYTEEEWDILRYLIHLLDERGFFPYTAEDVAGISSYDEKTVKRLLKTLKTLEPAGIFAQDLGECLIMQLKRQGDTDEMLLRMIRECMEDVLNGKISNVTRKLEIPTAQVREYIRRIGMLHPRPLAQLSQHEQTTYIIPDVLASFENGAWQVSLNDNWMGIYRLDGYYLRMMHDTRDEELKSYFREKLSRAHFMIDAVERRRNTILKISETVLNRQQDFFLHGEALKPMTLEDVADAIGMHASTVSRAIRGKYISCRKTLPFKSLFQTSVGQKDVSGDAVRKAILKAVETEDRAKPLSDSAIEKILAAEGLCASRRTIAKYRMEMGIPDSRNRGAYLP